MRRWRRAWVVAVAALAVIAAVPGRAPYWDRVRDALSKGLPKTALESIDPIIRGAQDERAYAEAIRAIALKIALEAGIQGNHPEEKITRMQAAIARAPADMRPPMEAILADWYWQYFQRNRWRFAQRSRTAAMPDSDFTTWDLPRIYAEIDAHFTRALAGAPQLKRTPVAEYADLFVGGNAPDAYRPTLYDLVAFEALAFYGSGEQAGARPEDAFVLQAAGPAFAPAEEFARWAIAATDTTSPILKGLRLHQQLLRFHASDHDPTARIDADLWRIEFAHDHAVGDSRDARYAAALERLIDRHADHELSARALHSLATLRQAQGDLVLAHALAKRGLDRFPESVGGRRCFNLIQDIEAQSLAVTSSDNVWNEPRPTLEVSYRNLDRVHFRLVAVDFPQQMERRSGTYDYYSRERVDYILGLPPLRQWSAPLPGTPDFRTRSIRLPAPTGLASGAYFLVSSMSGDFREENNSIAIAEIWVSDLALVTRQGRPAGLEGFVLRAADGAPLAGAAIRTWRWDRAARHVVPGPNARTGADGLFHILDAHELAGLMVTRGDQKLGESDRLANYEAPAPRAPAERTLFFTDRALYRPGQPIQYKGLCIRLDTERDDYLTLADRAVHVVLRDANRREVATADLRTNSHGSFSGSFVAPGDALLGAMSLAVGRGPDGSTGIRVEEYKRPRFLVTLDSPLTPARLADSVAVTGHALAYTGAPVDGAAVKWRVLRQVRYPDWWGWCFWWRPSATGGSQEIAHGSATTDAEGRFTIPFVARPDSAVAADQEPTFRFSVMADITDATGETRSATRAVSVGFTALAASLGAADWQQSDRPVEILVSTATLDGAAQAARGTLRIVRLREPARVSRAAYTDAAAAPAAAPAGGASVGGSAAAPPIDAADPRTWPDGEVAIERQVRTDSSGSVRSAVQLAAGLYRARFEARDRFGRRVTAMLPLRVIDPAAARCAIRVADLFTAPTFSVEVGGEFVAVWGTGYPAGRAYVEVEHRGRVLQAYWTEPGRTQVAIRQRVDAAMRGGFLVRVTRVCENRAYLHEQRVDVPWSDRVLSLRWEHFVSKLQPGQHETWTAVVTGPDASRVSAEMVATLYDASLDAYARHGWLGRIGGFRTEWNPRGAQSRLGAAALQTVRGSWVRAWRDSWLQYRSLPSGLLWGDYTYGLLGMPAPGSRGDPRLGVEVGAARELNTKPATTRQSISAERLSGIPVDNVREELSVMAGIASEGDELHFRGGRGGELKRQFDGVAVSDASATPEPALDQVVARRNLAETAFFFPHLLTDSRRRGAHGVHDARGAHGVALPRLRARRSPAQRHAGGAGRHRQGPDGAAESAALPARGGRAGVHGQGDEPLRGAAARPHPADIRRAPATARPPTRRSATREPEVALEVPARASHTYAWRIRVPDGLGVLTYKAVASTGTLSDGEEGYVPVLSRRILVIESLPLPIRGPLTRTFDFERLRRSGESSTLVSQSLTVQMVSNPAWYAVMALPYLIEYPYECSEQTFNRLYANALARHIANSDPRIRRVFDQWRDTPALESPLERNADLKAVTLAETPWLVQAQSESRARRNVGILFERGRLDRETARVIEQLRRMQTEDGRWPWFPGGPPNDYITLYITTGFGRLRHLGVDVPVDPALRALTSLDAWSDRMYREILHWGRKDDDHLSPVIALYLYGRSFYLKDQPIAPAHREAVDYWLAQARRYWLRHPERQTRGHLAIALLRFGDATTAHDIMRSVKEYAVTDEELGMFWRDTEYSWWWYRAPIETQAMMIEAFDEVMGDSSAVEGCKVWLLKQKQTQDWKTTKATADAVYALLLRGTGVLASEALVQVSLGDTLIRPRNAEAGTGYFERRFVGREIEPTMARVQVTKTDPGVAWGSVHWQYLEDMDKVTPYAGTPLRLTKSLFVRTSGKAGPELHAVTGPVKVGDELVVRIELRTDRDMEYVHLKDQRGSGVEPVNVLSRYQYQDGLRYYEQTRDVASHFFIDYLPKGTYVFEYPVRVQLRGRYTSGMAEIQCMYAPEFNSHSASVPLTVQ